MTQQEKQLLEEAKKYSSVSDGGVTVNNPTKYRAFRDGQIYTYNLLSKEIGEKETRITELENALKLVRSEIEMMEPKVKNVEQTLLKSEREIERLKGLIEKAFDHALNNKFSRYPSKVFEQFKKDNQL